MFAQTRRVRRLAAQVLLVWLFALASGIVNACVIAPGLLSGAEGRTLLLSVEPASDGADHSGCPECPGDDDSGVASQGACGKFCVDQSSSAPRAQLDFDPGPALDVALVPTMALSVAQPVREATRRPDSGPPRLAAIPVSLAYLRLTL